MKTDELTQTWARKIAIYIFVYFGVFIAIVSLWTPYLNEQLYQRWLSWPNVLYLSPIPIALAFCFIGCIRALKQEAEYKPFFLTITIFILCFIGLIVGLWPWIVPYHMTFYDAAAAPSSQSFLLVGTVFILPVILCYTAYSYYVFRGKSTHESMY